jgi:hypothetical protein
VCGRNACVLDRLCVAGGGEGGVGGVERSGGFVCGINGVIGDGDGDM